MMPFTEKSDIASYMVAIVKYYSGAFCLDTASVLTGRFIHQYQKYEMPDCYTIQDIRLARVSKNSLTSVRSGHLDCIMML